MHDSLNNGRPFRTFNVINDHNKEATDSTIDTSLSARRITRELDRLIEWRGTPEAIRVDNGPEFTSAVLKFGLENIKLNCVLFSQGNSPRITGGTL